MSDSNSNSDAAPNSSSDSGSETAERTGFEEHLRSVEDSIRRLESGDIPLEDSIDLYAGAMKHLKACHGFLESAEARLEIVRQGAAGPHAEDATDALDA